MAGKKLSGWNWTKLALIGSLSVNFLVLGLLGGMWWSGGHHKSGGQPASATAPLQIGPYGRAFSKEDRAEMRRAFEQQRPKFRETRRAMRGFAKELAEALRADAFDRALVEDILARQMTQITMAQQSGQEIMLDRLEAMSPSERAAFADRLETGLNRRKRRNP